MNASDTQLAAPDSLPVLERFESGGVTLSCDPRLRDRAGIIVAFTDRIGGVSAEPYDSLNLAAHVGDDPDSVDENRSRLLRSVGMEQLRSRLVTAEQVHGTHVGEVTAADAGRGARAIGPGPIPQTDALLTCESALPLLMLYADCVPIILVAETPKRAVAVVHSGWRGTIESIVARALESLVCLAGADASDVRGYIGPHIRSCCYEVDEGLVSQFGNRFDTITAVDGHLDLEAAVVESMVGSGMSHQMIATSGLCTRDLTDRYFSYRAHRVTGRHGALAVITKVE